MKNYSTLLRISFIQEVKKDYTEIMVTCQIVPIPDDLSNTKYPEESELVKVYEDNTDKIVKKAAKLIKDLAIEILEMSDKEKSAIKMGDLKMKLISKEASFDKKNNLLNILLVFKPFIAPVFEEDFTYEGIILIEEIGGKDD